MAKLKDVDMLRAENLTLRLQLLEKDKAALGVELLATYSPGAPIGATMNISADGTFVVMAPDGTVIEQPQAP